MRDTRRTLEGVTMKLTDAERTRQYLLLVTANAVRARLEDVANIDYSIDRLQRVIVQATEVGQSEIAIIAEGELDVAKRIKEEAGATQ